MVVEVVYCKCEGRTLLKMYKVLDEVHKNLKPYGKCEESLKYITGRLSTM